MPPRKVIDITRPNTHGDAFIEFLKDIKLCMLNGRFDPQKDNYTSISNRGRSVVDYVLTPHDCFEYCKDFKVESVTSLLDKFKLVDLVGERSRPPDHSVLSFKFVTNYMPEDVATEPIKSHGGRRYYFEHVPDTFMSTEIWTEGIRVLIDTFLNMANNQEDLDSSYDNMCKLILLEMDTKLRFKDASTNVRKRFKNAKPYWDDS